MFGRDRRRKRLLQEFEEHIALRVEENLLVCCWWHCQWRAICQRDMLLE